MNILIVDDNQDARMILEKIIKNRGYGVRTAFNGKDALEKARRERPDLIISDILMPEMDGFSFCRSVKQDDELKEIPFVFYTASYVDERDEKLALELGASRFIRKPLEPADFIAAISDVVEEARNGRVPVNLKDSANEKAILKLYNERLIFKLEEKMEALEKEIVRRKRTEAELVLLRNLADQSNDIYFVINTDTGSFVDVNTMACQSLGYDREELLQKKVMDIVSGLPDITAWERHVAKIRKSGRLILEGEHRRKNGTLFPVEVSVKIIRYDGIEYFIAIARDIREKKKAQQAIEESKNRFYSLISSSADHIFMLDLNGVYIESNDHVDEINFKNGSDLVGKSIEDVHSKKTLAIYREKIDELIKTKSTIRFEHTLTGEDGRVMEYEDTLYPIMKNGKIYAIGGICRDVTEHKLLEKQFRQAQKMEAVGRLAGGVAHDFNNMLSIILGYAELGLSELTPSDPMYKGLNEICKAGRRSADITRQLLAFARKQPISPKVMDINKAVADNIKMLVRLIGEDIDLKFTPDKALWKVLMDSTQVNQILINLAVNARDAIDGVGKISIETHNVFFDENYCRIHNDVTPGQYVLIEFSDTGCGMAKKIREKVFEPFFTTKEEGKGTGLGLSTIFGIISQNKGFVKVYSEQGIGTSFKIYLPRQIESGREIKKEKYQIPMSGSETVLVVEDEEQILNLCTKVLKMKGYNVLAASLPEEAIDLCKEYDKKIDLLLTDVVMPAMNGKDLKNKIEAMHPGIKAIFMSGYTADIIESRGVLDEGISFLQKPFSINALALKVRQALDEE